MSTSMDALRVAVSSRGVAGCKAPIEVAYLKAVPKISSPSLCCASLRLASSSTSLESLSGPSLNADSNSPIGDRFLRNFDHPISEKAQPCGLAAHLC